MPPTPTDSALAKLEACLQDPPEDLIFEDYQRMADEAIEQARENRGSDLMSEQELARGLELRAGFSLQVAAYEDAKADYSEVLDLLGKTADSDEGLARAYAGLAQAHELNGEADGAKSFYQRAIAAYERVSPTPVLLIADISNNLAFLYEADDDFDKAETFLLSASKAYHETAGPEHEQTAVLYNNVGTLYFKAGHDDRAKQMHRLALDSRTKIFGNTHVETAQSHGNLALVLVREGRINEGRAHFDKALEGLETDLENSRDDYEIVAANYGDVLESIRDPEAVAALKARLAQHGVS